MFSKETLLSAIHKLYRKDDWIGQLFKATGVQLDQLEGYINDLYDQYFFDSSSWGLKIYEKEMAIKSRVTASREERQAVLEARWKSSGKVDIYLLQAVADSWKNEGITVDFIDGKIQVTFVGDRGFAEDWAALEKALDDVKPAHLALMFLVIVQLSKTAIYFGSAVTIGSELIIYPMFSDELTSQGEIKLITYCKQGTNLTVYAKEEVIK